MTTASIHRLFTLHKAQITLLTFIEGCRQQRDIWGAEYFNNIYMRIAAEITTLETGEEMMNEAEVDEVFGNNLSVDSAGKFVFTPINGE